MMQKITRERSCEKWHIVIVKAVRKSCIVAAVRQYRLRRPAVWKGRPA